MVEWQEYKKHCKEYIRLALPMMIGSMAVVLISWGDTIMISKLGNNRILSASQLANQICSIPFLLLIGISTILSPLVTHSLVHKDYQEATKTLQHMIVINLTFGLLSTILIMSFSSKLHYLKQSAEVIDLAEKYLCIIAASIIPSAINNAVKRYLEALGWTVHTMYLSILAGLVNIILNYLLIYGKLGFPKLGLNGAGWATLTTRVILMIIHFIYILLLKKKGYLVGFSRKLFHEKSFIKLFKLGLPSGLYLAVKMSYFLSAMVLFGWCVHGEVAQASTGFLYDILRFVLMLPLAIGTSSSILISRQWARKKKDAILRLAKTGYIVTLLLIILVSSTLYLIYPFILSNLYESTLEVEKLIHSLIALILLFHFADGINVVGVGILRGLQDTLIPFFLSTFAYLCIGLPISYMLKENHQEAGIWIGLTVGLFCSAIFCLIRFYYKAKHIKLPSHYTAL